MKAKTKAAKLKQKRGGRPRNTNAIEREPNGKPSRRKDIQRMRNSMTEAEARSVVVAQRIKRDNIIPFRNKEGKVETPEERANDTRRGYVLGRMLLDGAITDAEHEAGLRYAEDMARYYGLTGIKFPSPRAQNLFAIHGYDGDDSEDRAAAARAISDKVTKLYNDMLGVSDRPTRIKCSIDEGRMIVHAVKEVVILDTEQARGWPAHMVRALRRGLRYLAVHYGLVDAKKMALDK